MKKKNAKQRAYKTTGKYFHFPRFMWLNALFENDNNSVTRTIDTHTLIKSY